MTLGSASTFRRGGECLEWPGKTHCGYGIVKLRGYETRAHRISYAVAYGEWLGNMEGLVVMHHCDNPRCFQPRHLSLGTDADNVHDMRAKGRIQHGARHYKTNLTSEEASLIGASTGPLGPVAERYGVSRATVSRLRSGKTWLSL